MSETAGTQLEEVHRHDLAPPHTRTTCSGILVETTDPKKALHVVCTRAGGGFDYYLLQGGDTWKGPIASMGSHGNVHSPVVLKGKDPSLDVVFREVEENCEIASSKDQAGHLVHTFAYYKITTDYPWTNARKEVVKEHSVIGTPGFCRWNDKDFGLEVIAPLAAGGLRHLYRDENNNGWSSTGKLFICNRFQSAAINMGPGKCLEVVALDEDGRLWHIRRNDKNQWIIPKTEIAQGFTGSPALVESARPDAAYDLIVPLSGGGIAHYTVSLELQFKKVATFGTDAVYNEIGLIYNQAKELEVVARRSGGMLEHFVNRLDGQGWGAGAAFPKVPNPSLVGSWNVQYDTDVIGVHASLLHTGQVLLFGIADETEHEAAGALLDPKTGEVAVLPGHMPHVFCGGHAWLGNGDLLVAGGHTGHEKDLHVFARDKDSQWRWRERPGFQNGRWYPTCTTLPDGRVLIISGSKNAGKDNINNSYEIYDPENFCGKRTVFELDHEIGEAFCDDQKTIDMYPFVYVLPNRRVFVHSRYTTRFLDYPKTGKGSWSTRILAKYKSSRTYGYQGTSVLLPLKPGDNENYDGARVAIIGGAGQGANVNTPATATMELLVTDSSANPSWVYGPNLLGGRVMPDAVLLPDGKVLITGGSRAGKGDAYNARQPELSIGRFEPEKNEVKNLAPMRTPRLYHASAVLLPDARVLVAGKCKFFNADPYDYPEHRGEVFTPPYLLTGNPRPKIAWATSQIASSGAKVEIKVESVHTSDIKSVLLIRPSTVTHSFNMDQRAVFLPFTVKNGMLEATAPKTNWVVPPGYYMLFIVSKDGVPSESRFVRVDRFPKH